MNKNLQEIQKQVQPRVTSPTNEVRWQKIIAHQESIGLQKEMLHLQNKSQQRVLSEWEQERLNEVQMLMAQSADGDNFAQ